LEPRDFLKVARCLVESSTGRPAQAHLRRAVSTIYYAMFHTLARCCANLFIGGKGADRSNPAWHQVYRALEHGTAKSACSHGKVNKFPKDIQEFAIGQHAGKASSRGLRPNGEGIQIVRE